MHSPKHSSTVLCPLKSVTLAGCHSTISVLREKRHGFWGAGAKQSMHSHADALAKGTVIQPSNCHIEKHNVQFKLENASLGKVSMIQWKCLEIIFAICVPIKSKILARNTNCSMLKNKSAHHRLAVSACLLQLFFWCQWKADVEKTPFGGHFFFLNV